MVVACPECGTRFSLDDSRISGNTAKVRCSRCRHVFRINRGGQVLAPPKEPPAAPLEEESPGQEVAEETSFPQATATVEPPPAPAEVEVPPAAAIPEEMRAPPEKNSRLWLWLPVLSLVVVIIGVLGWWAWQSSSGKSSSDAVQSLDKPALAAPAAKAGSSAPAPLVVIPPSLPVPSPELINLPVDWAQARYEGLVNPKGGQVLVIRGEVINTGKKLRGPIRLKAILTDAQHRPLREKVVYAGTTLTDEELKTLDPDKIKSWLVQPGGRSQDQELKPGEKQPFTVVFFGVPGSLAESRSGFQLVVVEGPVAEGVSARN
ncbi:MAG: DUF3426 domain-containing protein [Syntrophobacterales bacterium]|jgi:predicted Zn finger-like uncharacterized protein